MTRKVFFDKYDIRLSIFFAIIGTCSAWYERITRGQANYTEVIGLISTFAVIFQLYSSSKKLAGENEQLRSELDSLKRPEI